MDTTDPMTGYALGDEALIMPMRVLAGKPFALVRTMVQRAYPTHGRVHIETGERRPTTPPGYCLHPVRCGRACADRDGPRPVGGNPRNLPEKP
jgi:hypothetical protein